MDNASAHGEDVKLSGHVIVAEGCFGAVTWMVCDELYALLPRHKRDPLLDGASTRIIVPYFTGLTERMLRQVGDTTTTVATLDTSWSFETRTASCRFGTTEWQVGQGLWDHLPEDQRETLCLYTDNVMHDFFLKQVYTPMMGYAYRQIRG